MHNSSQCPFYPTTSFLYFPQYLLGCACLPMWTRHRGQLPWILFSHRGWVMKKDLFPKREGIQSQACNTGPGWFLLEKSWVSWEWYMGLGDLSRCVTGFVALGTECPLKLVRQIDQWIFHSLISLTPQRQGSHRRNSLWPANSLSLGE